MGLVVACGDASPSSIDDGESSSAPGETGCAGGAACTADQVCIIINEACECDPGFEHCELVARTPGCASLPFDCDGVDDPEACHVEAVCGSQPGEIEDGVLSCEPVDSCVGACDSVGGCQTAGGDPSGDDTAGESTTD